jgi:hypothetical protein
MAKLKNMQMENKKSLLEIILMPIIVGLVGVLGTYFISMQQIASAEKSARSDQQIKMLEIFSNKITSPNKNDQELAVRILNTMDPELARNLATAVFESDSVDSSIKNIASQYFEKSYYIVAGSFYNLEEAKRFADRLTSLKLPFGIHIYKNNRNVYAVCLGSPLSNDDAAKILKAVISRGDLNDTYLRVSSNWGEDLYK